MSKFYDIDLPFGENYEDTLSQILTDNIGEPKTMKEVYAPFKYLQKEYLDTASAAELHELRWVDDNEIAEIPRSYNHLVGYYKKHNKIKALHYTLGGPWFKEYENGELSEEWHKVLKG